MGKKQEKTQKMPRKQRLRQEKWVKNERKRRKCPESNVWDKKFGQRARESEEIVQKAASGIGNLGKEQEKAKK